MPGGGCLEAAERLQELPATNQVFRSGLLSETQAKEITAAAAASPGSEPELLRAAAAEGAVGLTRRCRQVRAAAEADELACHEAIHWSRYLRHWSDDGGGFRLDGRLAPEAGAVVLAALRPHQERIFAEARQVGRRESHEVPAPTPWWPWPEATNCQGPKPWWR